MKDFQEMNDELQTLKAQMEILTKNLKEKDILTDEMILKTTRNRIKPLVPSKLWIYFSFVLVGVVMPALFIFAHLVDGNFSTPYLCVTFLFFASIIYRCYKNLKLNVNDTLMNGSLTEVASKVAAMKQLNTKHAISTAILVLVWIGFYLVETWEDLSTNVDHAVVVFVIFTFVIASVAGKFHRVHKVTKDVLDKIEELKKA